MVPPVFPRSCLHPAGRAQRATPWVPPGAGLFFRFSFSFLLCLFLVLSFLVALFYFLFSVLVLLCFLFLACLIWFRFGLVCFACFVFYSLLRSSSRARLRIYDGDVPIGVIVFVILIVVLVSVLKVGVVLALVLVLSDGREEQEGTPLIWGIPEALGLPGRRPESNLESPTRAFQLICHRRFRSRFHLAFCFVVFVRGCSFWVVLLLLRLVVQVCRDTQTVLS